MANAIPRTFLGYLDFPQIKKWKTVVLMLEHAKNTKQSFEQKLQVRETDQDMLVPDLLLHPPQTSRAR